MNDTVFRQLLQLNTQFYQQIGSEFSATRQSAWPGWRRLLPLISDTGMTVLDLGCGNGRFYEFLQQGNKEVQYTGMDMNSTLIGGAAVKSISVSLRDVILNLPTEKKCDLVCAFGLTHHIPSHDFRMKWFSEVSDLVTKNGYLVLTFWDFQENTKHAPVRTIQTPSFSFQEKDLEEGDYFLGWDKKPDVWRYCHFYSEQELLEVEQICTDKGLSLIDKYESDGKNGKMNRYMVFQRIC